MMTAKTSAAWMFIALLVLLAMGGGAEAFGGERGPFLGFGVHGNYFNTGDADDGSIRGGLQIRLRVTQNLSVEGAADYRKENFEDGNISVEGYPFQLSGIWYLFGRGGINPHLIVGGSWYNSEVTLRGNTHGGLSQKFNSDDFGYHGGLGIDLHFTERSFFHLDVRYMILDVDYGDVITGDYGGQTLDHDGYVIQAGLTYYF